MSILFHILTGIMAITLPLLSTFIWYHLFELIFPGFKATVARILRIGNHPKWKRNVSLSSAQLMVYLTSIITIPIVVMLEFAVFIPMILILGQESPFGQTLMVASAGPIEEIMKLVTAVLVYLLIIWSFGRKKRNVNHIQVGIIAGLFTGACFGFVESIGYISAGLWEMVNSGLSVMTVDSLIWRVVLGVSIHAVYTGLSAGGLGRNGWSSRIKVTLILVALSVLLHTLNNGIQGLIVLILDMDNLTGLVITDSLQLALIVIGFTTLSLVWRGILFRD